MTHTPLFRIRHLFASVPQLARGIRGKLILLAAVFAAAFAGSMISQNMIVEKVRIGSTTYNKITDLRFVLEDVSALGANIRAMNSAAGSLCAITDPDKLMEAVYGLDDYRTNIVGVVASMKEAAKKNDKAFALQVDSLDKAWAAYNSACDETLTPLLLDGKLEDARAYVDGDFGLLFKALTLRADAIKGTIRTSVDRLESDVWKSAQRARSLNLLLSIALIAAVLCFMFWIAASIIHPIRTSIAIVKDIAEGEGDLTRRIGLVSKDEIGELTRWIDVFINKLQGLIQDIAENAGKVAASADELALASKAIAGSSEDISRQSSTVAAATEEATLTLNSISDGTNQVSDSTNAIADSIEGMTRSLGSVADNCASELRIVQDAADRARHAEETIRALVASGEKIEKVVKTINSIAERTGILSINARIEAAIAGESGRGFAVVANEVSDLARQTTAATKEIVDQVFEIQQGTRTSADSIVSIMGIMEKLSEVSQEISRKVADQTREVQGISSNATTSSSGVHSVARNISDTAAGLTEVAQSIQRVSTEVGKTVVSIAGINDLAESMRGLSGRLSHSVGQFRT